MRRFGHTFEPTPEEAAAVERANQRAMAAHLNAMAAESRAGNARGGHHRG